MSVWSSRILAGWMAFPLVALATADSGARLVEPPVPLHPLVLVTEKVCQRGLVNACEELMKLSSVATGLTIDDSIHLLWVGVLRSLGNNDENRARLGISQILGVDRSAKPPAAAPARIGELLEEVRTLLPSAGSPSDERSRLANAKKAAAERKPEPEVLLEAVQTLYDSLEMEGTAMVIDLARSSSLLTKAQRAKVAVWLGVLKMELETEDEAGVRALFRIALEFDSDVQLPNNVPPRTLGVFNEVKTTVGPPTPPTTEPVRFPDSRSPAIVKNPSSEEPKTPLGGLQLWGAVTVGSGAALVVGGAVVGAFAHSAYEAERTAASTGDWDGYVQNRDRAGTAVITANVLYGAGAVTLGVGAVLFMSKPGNAKVVPDVAPGKVSITIGGSF